MEKGDGAQDSSPGLPSCQRAGGGCGKDTAADHPITFRWRVSYSDLSSVLGISLYKYLAIAPGITLYTHNLPPLTSVIFFTSLNKV